MYKTNIHIKINIFNYNSKSIEITKSYKITKTFQQFLNLKLKLRRIPFINYKSKPKLRMSETNKASKHLATVISQ